MAAILENDCHGHHGPNSGWVNIQICWWYINLLVCQICCFHENLHYRFAKLLYYCEPKLPHIIYNRMLHMRRYSGRQASPLSPHTSFNDILANNDQIKIDRKNCHLCLGCITAVMVRKVADKYLERFLQRLGSVKSAIYMVKLFATTRIVVSMKVELHRFVKRSDAPYRPYFWIF